MYINRHKNQTVGGFVVSGESFKKTLKKSFK